MDGPYKGLVPYGEEDYQYFFGRGKEQRIIAANLRASRLTVLYGGSGVGKSSLLSAGVAHDFRNHPDYTVVVFRSWRATPAAGLIAAIAHADPAVDKAFAGGPLPPSLIEVLKGWNGYLKDECRRALLIILDQFEEYFQYHPCEEGSPTFLKELSQLVTSPSLPINLLISIREDSLARLDCFEGIPNLFDNRLRVDYLTAEAAEEAILEPLHKFSELNPEREMNMGQALAALVVREIINAQVDETRRVQTPYLQLVMSRWWEQEENAGSHVMREKTLFGELGGMKSIVDRHLRTTVDALPPDEKNAAPKIFDRMVTRSGRKEMRTVGELEQETGLANSLVKAFLEKLTNSRILVCVPPPFGMRSHDNYYEFAHDMVAAAAAKWLNEYKSEAMDPQNRVFDP